MDGELDVLMPRESIFGGQEYPLITVEVLRGREPNDLPVAAIDVYDEDLGPSVIAGPDETWPEAPEKASVQLTIAEAEQLAESLAQAISVMREHR
jgi:hypothetical protein